MYSPSRRIWLTDSECVVGHSENGAGSAILRTGNRRCGRRYFQISEEEGLTAITNPSVSPVSHIYGSGVFRPTGFHGHYKTLAD
jgi:hypothetical protein